MSGELVEAIALRVEEDIVVGCCAPSRREAREIAQAALSALDAMGLAVVPGWQDIASAPRDGTPLLLYIPGQLQPDEDSPFAVGRWAEDAWGKMNWCMDAGDFWPGATHWMPLPAPPLAARDHP